MEEVVFMKRRWRMPREQALIVRKMLRLIKASLFSPLVFLCVCQLLPTHLLVQAASLSNELVWRHIKTIAVDGCAEACHMMSYIMLGIPISWIGACIVAAWAIPITVQLWRVGAGARRSDGTYTVKTPPVLMVCSGVLGMCVAVAMFLGLVLLLNSGAGVRHAIRNGREVWPFSVEIAAAIVMGLVQLLGGAVAMMVTGIILNVAKFINAETEG